MTLTSACLFISQGVTHQQWYLFNDFLIEPIDKVNQRFLFPLWFFWRDIERVVLCDQGVVEFAVLLPCLQSVGITGVVTAPLPLLFTHLC